MQQFVQQGDFFMTSAKSKLKKKALTSSWESNLPKNGISPKKLLTVSPSIMRTNPFHLPSRSLSILLMPFQGLDPALDMNRLKSISEDYPILKILPLLLPVLKRLTQFRLAEKLGLLLNRQLLMMRARSIYLTRLGKNWKKN